MVPLNVKASYFMSPPLLPGSLLPLMLSALCSVCPSLLSESILLSTLYVGYLLFLLTFVFYYLFFLLYHHHNWRFHFYIKVASKGISAIVVRYQWETIAGTFLFFTFYYPTF